MIGHSLIHRCTVERRSGTAKPYGNQATYTDHLLSEHCRLITKAQRGFNSITGLFQVATSYTMLFRFDTDVQAGDRINSIVDEAGVSIAGNFEIEGVLPRRGQVSRHKAAVLNKVA